MAASILTAGVGGVSSLLSKFGNVANKIGSSVVKVVEKAAEALVKNVFAKFRQWLRALRTVFVLPGQLR